MIRSFFIYLFCAASLAAFSQQEYLFIGSYTNTGSKGIYVYRFDADAGVATWVSNTEGIVNPSYLAIAPDKKHVYACTETRTANAGSVSAFSFDAATGSLNFLNKQPSGGDNPVYVAVHKTQKWVVVGNYTGGSLSAFKINEDGSLQTAAQTIKHNGSSIDTARQQSSHVHSTVFSPAHDYLFVPDLGMDKIMTYQFTATVDKPLQPAATPFTETVPGTGPRHLTFHPNGKWAYLAEEMGGNVIAYEYKKGKLKQLQSLPTHAAPIKEGYGAADVHASPDGRFLYVSNRGQENNIAIFSITEKGTLVPAGYQSTLGTVPRNFVIDPSGKYLMVANQESGNVVIFKRDVQTGALEPTGQQIRVPQVSCLQMMLTNQ